MPTPVNEHMIVKPLPRKEKTKQGLFIPETAKTPTIQTEVISCAENNPRGINVGDKVLIPDEIGIPIEIDEQNCLIIKEQSVIMIL